MQLDVLCGFRNVNYIVNHIVNYIALGTKCTS